MTQQEFESLLDKCCILLTSEARKTGFNTANQFEKRVREVLSELTKTTLRLISILSLTLKHFPILQWENTV